MSVQAIDNSGLVGYCNTGCSIAGFTPVVTYTYDPAAAAGVGQVVIQDGSTIPAGDTLKKVHVRVLDDFGNEVRDTITVTGAPGAKTITLTGLDKSRGVKIMATVLTTGNIAADGSAVPAFSAGSIGTWDSQKNA